MRKYRTDIQSHAVRLVLQRLPAAIIHLQLTKTLSVLPKCEITQIQILSCAFYFRDHVIFRLPLNYEMQRLRTGLFVDKSNIIPEV